MYSILGLEEMGPSREVLLHREPLNSASLETSIINVITRMN